MKYDEQVGGGARSAPPPADEKSATAKKEEAILALWRDEATFEQSLAKDAPKGSFVFYDGPPFATGLPHYGHLLASTIKDAIPRYKTMCGYHVRRVWGWDCHGLPIENMIEKEFGLKNKADIEHFGIERFNTAACQSVLTYDAQWKETIPRLGRFVDMEACYKTMDTPYTESVWWGFKQLHEKGLVYEGHKAMHLCPRCETTLSQNEVSEGYKPLTDISVTVKFALRDEPDTYLLAWTTTPWTLPGNVALAIGPQIEYVKVATRREDGTPEYLIVSKDYLQHLTIEHELVGTMRGHELVGKTYLPPFVHYFTSDIAQAENGWKVYEASFVDTTKGTGIVHIAPAFGEDDMALGITRNLPFIQHVAKDGTIKPEVVELAGLQAKPKDDPQATDVAVIKYLATRNLLFKKEKIVHSYPHCWRCDTPLLNYATSSWFIAVSKLKDRLIAENKKISWVPEHIGEGRFANWLEGARDWAVSRSRFWGAPIPVWKCASCERVEVVGSVEEMRTKALLANNTYFIMRHGEAQNNVQNIVNGAVDAAYRLTERGREQAATTGRALAGKGIGRIVASPLPRAQETAHIVARELGLGVDAVITDERLREIGMGTFEGKTIDEYHAFFSPWKEKFTKAPERGENFNDLRKRVMAALYDLEKKYAGETILIVSHSDPLLMIRTATAGLDDDGAAGVIWSRGYALATGESSLLDFKHLPHNADYIADLHRPYIDTVELQCACGHTMRRIPDVFDCWFESASMPFAQMHYPFENKELFTKNFPADFIAEGVDQTRGWFYNMLVMAVGIFGETSYKHVIVNGIILAEDGQKMSKKLKNYPDVGAILNTYGADALRCYMMSSPVVRADDLHFSEGGVREMHNKLMARLRNVTAFYELYKNAAPAVEEHLPKNILDRWVMARLAEAIIAVSDALDRYELDRAMRPLMEFVDDLSTWYLRRSRERFKGDDSEDTGRAIATLRFVLCEFSKVLAPFAPFLAEETYRAVRRDTDPHSVHLTDWPTPPEGIVALISGASACVLDAQCERVVAEMARVRQIVSLALEARAKAGIKVRQPLAVLMVRDVEAGLAAAPELVALIKDEVNVKEVRFGVPQDTEVALDTELTPALVEEGHVRELIRHIQELRKATGLTPSDRALLTVGADAAGEAIVRNHEATISAAALLSSITLKAAEGGHTVAVGELAFSLAIEKKR